MDKILNTSDAQISVPFTDPNGKPDSVPVQPKAIAELLTGSYIEPSFLNDHPELKYHPEQPPKQPEPQTDTESD